MIINNPCGNGLYKLSMVIWGMVHYCYTHIITDHFNLQAIELNQAFFHINQILPECRPTSKKPAASWNPFSFHAPDMKNH